VSLLRPNTPDLHFVDLGIKINRQYEQYVFLSIEVTELLVIHEVLEIFISCQDSAPVHRGCETVRLLKRKITEVTSSDL